MIVLTVFLNFPSFMLLQANGTNCVNISEHQILIVSERLLKQCIYTTIWMLTENNYICIVHIIFISVLITVNYCNAICYLVY